MNSNEHIERKNSPRAGLIPYFITKDGTIEYMFMMPSNPKFGGPFLQISKGMIDDDEDTLTTAIREAEEELGFKESNGFDYEHLVKDVVTTRAEVYFMDVYFCKVKKQFDFIKPHYETKYTTWVTNEQFQREGRRGHLKYVDEIEDILRERIRNGELECWVDKE